MYKARMSGSCCRIGRLGSVTLVRGDDAGSSEDGDIALDERGDGRGLAGRELGMLTRGLGVFSELLVLAGAETVWEVRAIEKRDTLRALEGGCREESGEFGIAIGSLRIRDIARASAMSSAKSIS